MENRQPYHLHHGFSARMDLPSHGPPPTLNASPLPPNTSWPPPLINAPGPLPINARPPPPINAEPPAPSNAQHHQFGYIPYSTQYQGQPPPSAFQASRFTEAASPQSSRFTEIASAQNSRFTETAFHQPPTPSSAFHSHVQPPQPNFSQPPPSCPSLGSALPNPNIGVPHEMNRLPPQQDYANYQVPPQQSFGQFPSSSLSSNQFPPGSIFSVGSYNLPSPKSSKDFDSSGFLDARHRQSTSVITDVSQGLTEHEGRDKTTWLRDFEQEILKRTENQNDDDTTKKKSLKIIEVQKIVSQAQILTEKLFQLKEKMSVVSQDDQDQIWLGLVDQTEKIKAELSSITQKFQDNLFVEDVQRLIQQRRRKRENRKRQIKSKVMEKKKLEESWKREEGKIDAWREKIRLKEEEERREVAIKTEADSILGEVRQKQIDGVKMQQLLENIITLRITRLNKGAPHGFISTPQQDQLFTTTLKKITDVVNAQMEEYKLEEQTLRVMMEECTSHKRSNTGKEPKDAINKLENSLKKVFFGDMAPIDQETYNDFTAADRCLETLMQRRHEWDQFLCEEDLPLVSSVPPNWVMPPTHPAAPWEEYRS